MDKPQLGTLLDEGGNTFTHRNEQGFLEVIDVHTGDVLLVQRSSTDIIKNKEALATEITLPDGRKMLVEKGMNLDTISKVSDFKYSEVIGDIIAQKLAEGGKITHICKEEGMPPYNIVRKWREMIPGFAEKLKAAEGARAEVRMDNLASITELGAGGGILKDEAAGYRIAMDGFSKLAESDSPGKYGKSKESQKVQINIMIDTGVPRIAQPTEGHSNEIEVEGLPVIEVGREDKG